MQQVAAVLQRHPNWGEVEIGLRLPECRRVLLRGLFRVEAQYAARFRQQFLDDERIRIPGVIRELRARVGCSAWITCQGSRSTIAPP